MPAVLTPSHRRQDIWSTCLLYTSSVFSKEGGSFLEHFLSAKQPGKFSQSSGGGITGEAVQNVPQGGIVFLLHTLADLFLCICVGFQTANDRPEIPDMAQLDAAARPKALSLIHIF